jgi:hypothetical protein
VLIYVDYKSAIVGGWITQQWFEANYRITRIFSDSHTGSAHFFLSFHLSPHQCYFIQFAAGNSFILPCEDLR